MELQYFGANCVKLNTKKASVIVDDNLTELGLVSPAKAGDIALFTGPHSDPTKEAKLIIDHPGEYEVSDVSIHGIAARSHMEETGKKDATIFKLIIDDVRVVIVGHIYPELDDSQLEAIGTVDVMIIPVGGNGYTLDPIGALKLIKKIEPKLVIPTHYADKGVKYPVPQQELEVVLKELAMEPRETTEKLKIKPAELTDTTQLVVLTRQ